MASSLRKGVVAMLCGVLLSACGELQPMDASGQMIDYRVSRGDTLYSIAWRYGYDHQEVAAWNNISPPFIIHPGDHIYLIPPGREGPARLPLNTASGETTQAKAQPSDNSSTGNRDTSRPTTSTVVSTLRNKVKNTYQRIRNSTVHWAWPTTGKVLNGYSPGKGKKGLDIGGRIGQQIRAAAGGTVVYSGSGLIGYGKLVIIKHNDSYLSAYGHNSKLLVTEGKTVKQGEIIAEMGDSGKQGVMLHFEIRRNGKPVDPLSYLPRKGS
jgi:lipoprotein NlpD